MGRFSLEYHNNRDENGDQPRKKKETIFLKEREEICLSARQPIAD